MRRGQWLLLAGLVAVSVNLRPAVASVVPILETIRADLAVSNAAASLLTTVPVVCMGVFAFLTVAVDLRRSRVLFWGLVAIALATAARVGGRHAAVLFGSTLLVSVSIGVTQAVFPALVTESFPERASFVTGLYTASMTVGAILATLLTAPLAALLSWPVALAVWALPAVVVVPAWVAVSRRGWVATTDETRPPGASGTGEMRASPRAATARDALAAIPWQRRSAWVLVAVFGGATATFFTVLTWLPPRYVALGWSQTAAGLLIGGCLAAQILSNLFISAVGDGWRDKRPLFALMLASLVAGASGVALAPRVAPPLWALLLGLGSGGLFTLSMTLPVTHAETPAETDRVTAMMLGVGYVLGALGPVAGGVVRDLTQSDTAIFGALAAFGLCLLAPVAALGRSPG
jgi:CP family cyanate transporter-like MFS transporter